MWKDTKGQEFILYDPHAYEVPFPYENIHDSNLEAYYEREAIRGFLLSLGDANEQGWGLCSLKRFNDFRKYLKRVHISLVHTALERQVGFVIVITWSILKRQFLDWFRKHLKMRSDWSTTTSK